MPCFAFEGHRVFYTREGAGDPIVFLPNATGLPPLCWIWGRDNKILPYEVGKRQLDVLDANEAHVIDGRGYAVAWDAPDDVNRIVERFLNRHRRISLNGQEIDVAEPAFP